MTRRWIAVLLTALAAGAMLQPGCGGSSRERDAGDGDGDADVAVDAGPDGDSDVDADTDVDADAGGDADADAGGDGDAEGPEDPDGGDAAPVLDGDLDGGGPTSGELLVLTYNVAGLPDWLSGSSPARNTPLISPLLNGYELVLVQEDFWYHTALAADATHPYQSDPMVDPPRLWRMGDGLNRFSVVPFGELTRVTWVECNGVVDANNDCLTTKGFSTAVTDLAPGVSACVYNLHMDAGGEAGDITARERQGVQLADDIATRCAGLPVLLAGDTNLSARRPEDMVVLGAIMDAAGLDDACRALSCGDERIDRVLYRSSATVTVEPLSWSLPTEFVDGSGASLSDHEPVAVRLRWSLVGADG